ncbi:MAG: response regulator [Nanoarchaeota archaeon]|nr:response regulator [Nanoarchaeota archaeon]
MKGSILLVEDEDYSASLKRAIERKDYFVILYRDGQEAIDEIKNGLKYNLAIIDLSIPKIDGEEVINLCKQINPNIPVFSFSGYSYKPKSSDMHIGKPIILEDLIEIIDSYFPKKEL